MSDPRKATARYRYDERPHVRAARIVHETLRRRDRAQWPPRSFDEIRIERHAPAISRRRAGSHEHEDALRVHPLGGTVESAVCVGRKTRPAEPRSFRIRFAELLRTQVSISRCISALLTAAAGLVRVLPSVGPSMSARSQHSAERPTTKDFRVICDCQRHAMRERTLWRRSVRAAGHLKHGGFVLLLGVPLALGVVEIPTINSSASETRAVVVPQSAYGFRIFTTAKVRSEFLDPQPEPAALTLEVTKEEFFRTRVPYGKIIYREAARNHLAPELVAAVIQAESDFRPRLISEKNAQGLMQIVPETGQLLGANNLFDPEQNIVAGTKYLRYLIDRFGNLRMALAAYNAGEGNIEKFGGVPPFAETTAYVQRVSSEARWYRIQVRQSYLASARVSTSYAR